MTSLTGGATIAELADVLHLDPADLEIAVGAIRDDELWLEDGVLASGAVTFLHSVFDPNGERTVPELYPDRPAGTVVLPKRVHLADGVVHVSSVRRGLPPRETVCGIDTTTWVERDEVPIDTTRPCPVCFDPDRQ